MMARVKAFFKDNKDVVILFVGSRLLFAVILLISGSSYREVLGLFDAEHYRNIASSGYYVDGITVFFPVIPLLIRYIGDAGLIIVNQLTFFLSIYYLKKILKLYADRSAVTMTLAVLAVSPMALFTSIEYTESIFFFLTLLVFYLFEKDQKPLLTGLLLGLCVATRNTGSLLFFAVFIGMTLRIVLKKKGLRSGLRDILLCFIPATLISVIYPLFLQLRFGNWKVFMDAQYSFWIRMKSDIIRTLWISLKVIFTDQYSFDGQIDTIVLFKINEILSTGLMIFCVYLMIRRIAAMKISGKLDVPSLVSIIYTALFIFALCLTIRDPDIDCPTDSFYRYYAALFPLYIGIGRMPGAGIKVSFVISALITMLTASLFCMGIFFF